MPSMLCRNDAKNRLPCLPLTTPTLKAFPLVVFHIQSTLPEHILASYVYMKPFPDSTFTISYFSRNNIPVEILVKTHSKPLSI